MTEKPQHNRSSPAQWLTFSGVPLAVISVLLVLTLRDGSVIGVSERVLPYVAAFVPVAIIILCRELYLHLSGFLRIRLGIV